MKCSVRPWCKLCCHVLAATGCPATFSCFLSGNSIHISARQWEVLRPCLLSYHVKICQDDLLDVFYILSGNSSLTRRDSIELERRACYRMRCTLHMINPKHHEVWCSSEKVESRVSLFIQLRHAGWKLIPFWTVMTTHWMSWRRRCWKVPKRDSAAWLLTDEWEWVGAVADWKQSSEKPKEACFRGALMFFFRNANRKRTWECQDMQTEKNGSVSWCCQSVLQPFGSYHV